jgi:hypothetical protein
VNDSSLSGVSIHPTTHRSSSGTSAVGDRDDDAESDMCDDWAGILYCAYDHSESKYFGSGRNDVNGENVD